MADIVNYIHWHIRKDTQHIVWAGLERRAKSVNTIDETVLNELNDIIENNSQGIKGIILYSLQKKGFIAGADIDIFSKYNDTEAEQFIQLGQKVFNKLANMTIPTVAMINGICLGGGLELALACRYRIATEESSLGLPEVQLGIIPAWGGIPRSIRFLGAYKALTCLLLPGKNISAKKALALGLLDVMIPRRQLEAAAIHIIKNPPPKRQKHFTHYINSRITSKVMRFFLQRKVNPKHYPAPYAILDIVADPLKTNEIEIIKRLMVPGGTAKELIRVFYLKERLKHLGKTERKTTIKYIHVAGAGTMGTDIAALCALNGFYVTLSDINVDALGKAFIRAKKYFEKYCSNKQKLQATLDRLTIDFQGKGVEKADVIIEAIVENLIVKQNFFSDVEQRAKLNALLITNTSSLSISNIALNMKEPGRLSGLHFFNPATQMPLVEIIKKEEDTELFTEILAFVSQIGKLPVPVSDSPGFLVNRILAPYLMKGLDFINEGVVPEKIDEAAQNFGMLMGPIELADTIGLDICLTVAENLSHDQTIALLQEKVAAGKLGKKTREGFFRYNKHNRKICSWLSKQFLLKDEKIANNLIEAMLLEAKCCLKEKVVADKDLLDAAMIFGAGFAPFRGGPMQYAEQLNLSNINNREKSEK